MIAFVVVALLLLTVVFFVGYGVGRQGESGRAALRAEVKSLRSTLVKVGSVIRGYRGQLDLVGDAALREIDDEINNYWKDAKV